MIFIYSPLLLVTASLFVTSLSATPTGRRIVVVAHRGAHMSAPENTLAAIREAIRLGCDYVEVDVRTTRDGVLVLMHDRTVDRTTDGHGAVAELTLAEIRALDAGIKRGARWAGEKVPTFEEALALCRGRIRVYVDNKAGLPEQVVAALEKHGMVDRAVIYDSVERLHTFKKLRSRLWIMPGHPGSAEHIAALVSALKPETMDGNLREWTVEQVALAHRLGVQVWVDNLGENDNESGFKKALEMGVDAIQTDHPELLITYLKSKGLR